MPPSIETIDKLPPPPPHDRVNETAKANEEQDREAFKQALKRRMAGGDRRADDGPDDPLIVDVDLSKQESPPDQENRDDDPTEPHQAQDRAADADDREEPPAPLHIDLQA